MTTDAIDRLGHIRDSVLTIRRLLSGKKEADVESDIVLRAAIERFLEVVSEASRHIPAEWKEKYGPDVPWRDIANFGNVLRHAYQHVATSVLWTVYIDDLGPLEGAIDAMIAAHSIGDLGS